MKQVLFSFFLIVLMSMVGAKAYAYDIEVENADGVTIYYNYINDGKDLEVAGCSGRGIVVIPEEVTYMNRTRKVTSIRENAFYKDRELTSIIIPNSVTNIGEKAFYGCSGLTSITISNSIKIIQKQVFYDCSGLTSITIPNSVTSIGKGAFLYCSGLTSITIPNSVTSIEDEAFYDCTGLTSITIPNSVKSIGRKTFKKCRGLTSITIPNSVTSIGENTFEDCSGLTSITIPNSVTSIGNGAFSYCRGLTSITIPNSVISIGGSTFYGCSSLTSITIPNSVTSIGVNAFGDCDLPVVISLIENPFKIDNPTFSNNTIKNATLYVPVGTIDKYKSTDGWKDFLFIKEGTGGGTTSKKCDTPTINYVNGILTFTCGTDGATCQYSITDTDIKAGTGNEVQLTATYTVSVYATASGYENSDVATATLCWLNTEPKTEGMTNNIASVRGNAILIQSYDGIINVSGADDGEAVSIYTTGGVMVGKNIVHGGHSSISTNIRSGEIAIIRIGNNSVKVVMQ